MPVFNLPESTGLNSYFREALNSRLDLSKSCESMSGIMFAKDLIGMEVVGQRGWKLGKIENVSVDTIGWTVKSLDVKLEKEVAERLKLKKFLRSTNLPVGTERVTGVGNVVSINYTQEDVDKLIDNQQGQEGPAQK
jgi:sporulation protein YlmC with PRC-barrel domain